jgi:uncharacterized membrane protein YdjX (TVP38/TMEM64 family)
VRLTWRQNVGSVWKKSLILLILAILITSVVITTDFGKRLSLSNIQKGASALKEQVRTHYVLAVWVFVLVYVAVNLWFPAAAVLTLLAGFLYGTVLGALYVDGAATVGAVVAFVMSREVAGTWIQHRWGEQLKGFNQAVARYGSEYLILVRVIPFMPYFLVNFLAGVTKVRLIDFAWTTALGSLPSILIFCYAGRQLMGIESVDQVLTFEVVMAFALLAVFVGSVTAVRWAMKRKRG